MRELVEFAFIGQKIDIDIKEKYVGEIFDPLVDAGLISSIDIYEIEDDSCCFYVAFNDLQPRKQCNWEVMVEFETFSHQVQLGVTIGSANYEPTIENSFLETLKISLKDGLKDDWERIVWLYDVDAEILSADLYPRIFNAENKLRKIINKIMFRTYGIDWWDIFVPQDIKAKHSGRYAGYRGLVKSFANIDDRLMSIDVGDLNTIIDGKVLKWNPKNDSKIEGLLMSNLEGKEKKVFELLKKQLIVNQDLWQKDFSIYFDENFKSDLRLFELNRNHIAHSKLLDRGAYNSIRKSIDALNTHLDPANALINGMLMSKETETVIQRYQQEEREQEEAVYKSIIEAESGVSILDDGEIRSLFEEKLYSVVDDISDALRFREDIEIEDSIFAADQKGELLIAKSKITDLEIHFSYVLDVDDSEGGESVLIIKSDKDATESWSINYINGAAEFDEYQSSYVPTVSDAFGDYAVEQFIDGVTDYINENIESLVDYIDNNKYSWKKDGANMPIVEDIYCEECGEEYICIDESIAQFGKCLNCGCMNAIAKCERCGTVYEINAVDNHSYGDLKLCSNCIDYYNRQ